MKQQFIYFRSVMYIQSFSNLQFVASNSGNSYSVAVFSWTCFTINCSKLHFSIHLIHAQLYMHLKKLTLTWYTWWWYR